MLVPGLDSNPQYLDWEISEWTTIPQYLHKISFKLIQTQYFTLWLDYKKIRIWIRWWSCGEKRLWKSENPTKGEEHDTETWKVGCYLFPSMLPPPKTPGCNTKLRTYLWWSPWKCVIFGFAQCWSTLVSQEKNLMLPGRPPTQNRWSSEEHLQWWGCEVNVR